MSLEWNSLLVDQLAWHWSYVWRPSLSSLTDAEYFWEPAPGCWSVRPHEAEQSSSTVRRWGRGAFVFERELEDLDPAPVTTIAWRMAHITVEVFGERVSSHFAGPPVALDAFDYAGTAAGALGQLDAGYAAWMDGVRSLGEQGLSRPCGPAEGPFADAPLAALVLHINREALHHCAEISLLRDLYRHQWGQPFTST